MSLPSSPQPAPLDEDATTLIEAVKALVKSELAPITTEIDQQGRYPREFLSRLGELGGFSASVPAAQGGGGYGLPTQIAVTTEVGRECGSTAFLVWCQSSCARYLLQSPNSAVRERYISDVMTGRLLSETACQTQ
ncbi:acyl-CoA dehydrogenase family protein [Achromobacter sp. F4_2707]|uniref:acyl-CoA dehydrogenase family protein n=1 Tax=Achromobacter sp. F4_2707 TaxID=3114286 RepID=UPI0039C5D89C